MAKKVGKHSASANDFLEPKPVINLTATDVGTNRAWNDGAADLSWALPSGSPEATLYTITTSPVTTTQTTTGTTYRFTGLAADNYTFTVVASNNAGASAGTTSSPATPITTVPNAPTSVSASSPNVNQDIVTWSAPSANGGKSVSSYTVISSDTATTPTVTNATSPLTVNEVGSSYQTYTIYAINANGSSAGATTNQVMTTPPFFPPFFPPYFPPFFPPFFPPYFPPFFPPYFPPFFPPFFPPYFPPFFPPYFPPFFPPYFVPPFFPPYFPPFFPPYFVPPFFPPYFPPFFPPYFVPPYFVPPFFPPYFVPPYFVPPFFPPYFVPPTFKAPYFPPYFVPPSFCIDGETEIASVDGLVKAKDVKVGDQILTVTYTENMEPRIYATEVTNIKVTETNELISFNNENTKVTPSEDVFIIKDEKHVSVKASDVQIGDTLVGIQSGEVQEIKVVSIEKLDSETTVYNFAPAGIIITTTIVVDHTK